MKNVEALSNSAFTPRLVLNQTLAECEDIDSLAIAINYKDGSMTTMLSCATVRDLAALSAILSHRLNKTITMAWDPE